MPQSSPSHARAPGLARTRAKVALILTSVCTLVAAVLVPLTSHLNAQAASQVPGTIPSLEGWTPASGSWTPAGGFQVVRTDSADAAGVSALLSRALTDAGIAGITEGTGAAPASNVVSLTINASRTDLGVEGYQLTVNANGAQVVAATRAGLLWGARTIEQAVRAGDGFRLRNAMTNQYLSVVDSGYLSRRPNGGEKTAEGTVAQLPLDVTVDSHSVFTLTSQASLALDVSIERVGDQAYPKTSLCGMDRASLPIVGGENWAKPSSRSPSPTRAPRMRPRST